ncbi:phosphoribosyltransferase family protein [Novosphingobium sp. Chol11]|uniref:phosphoribosyltransferase family protein n=1 Tax=Novosphingobium sp. Chol11 TaxID=1385763 RepID=UPI000BE2D381|nr:phosphoribosyltransferase family protein [Novosphingobium sp. Chol11]
MIELYAQCYYPSYTGYQSTDYPPNKFIKCLKGAAVNGYAHVVDIDGIAREISQTHRATAFSIFGKWAAQKIASLGLHNLTLVPIPSSSHVDTRADFTALKLCRAINQAGNDAFEILPCLTQREAVQGSSKGGSRKFVDIRDNLVCHQGLHGKTVVMVDDVVTSGNHMKACATVLRNNGAAVGHGMAAARTIWERPDNMWAVPMENIDWDATGCAFDFDL